MEYNVFLDQAPEQPIEQTQHTEFAVMGIFDKGPQVLIQNPDQQHADDGKINNEPPEGD